MTNLEAAVEASMTTIPCSELADLCRAGNEKTGSTRPGEASGMLSGQGFSNCWLADFAKAMQQDFKRNNSERLTCVFFICFGKDDERFPRCFSWCLWGSFCGVLLQIGFLLLAEHSQTVVVCVVCVIKHDDVRSLRRYGTTLDHISSIYAVNSSILQSIAVQCVFEIAGESATPRAP